MTTLVAAAHPDDEVLGCGGTIRRLSDEGHEVFLAIFGEGVTSRYERREDANESQVESLHARSRLVADKLGASELFLYGLPDNRFDTIPLLQVIKHIEQLLDRVEPEVIYTHHGGDLNVDHAVLHRAVMTATRPVPGHPVRELYTFEIPSSTEWAFGQFNGTFSPNVFVDISDTLEAKIEAMETYESEARRFPHPRAPEALEGLARRRGSAVGVAAAEAFEAVRVIR